MGSEKSPVASGGGERQARPEDSHTCCGCRFPLLIALLQLLLGSSTAIMAFFMASISPSLLARETPHWAGIILCVVSIVGFVLYCITYLPDERTSMQFIIKLLYFLLCSVGVVISILVIAFQGHHYSLTNGFACREMGENCVCTLEPEDPIARTFTYVEVSNCSAITSTLMLYYLLQMVLNLAQAIVCMVGAFIMWKHRYQVFFVGLQMGSPTSQHWQKV
ncbi:sarcospan [Pygocentrus nattereri]|uniref:Sarcospan (Kras oncogene-associated gene) n=1 Tax=Pygocentrus nattereri TaxID=42514 RepID=A0AAR2L675_PYGNA|nr:sarcospan [Pygocentrus nattereri]